MMRDLVRRFVARLWPDHSGQLAALDGGPGPEAPADPPDLISLDPFAKPTGDSVVAASGWCAPVGPDYDFGSWVST